MTIIVTDYLDVISSWCFWSEPTWAELRKRYEARVKFQWRVALMDPSGLPTSREQEQWFYRRSGMVMHSPFMLNTDWYDPGLQEWLAPNCVAEAAKDFGFTDDRVRLALARAALREGKQVADWNIAAEIGGEAGAIDASRISCAPDHTTPGVRHRHRDWRPRDFFGSRQAGTVSSNNRVHAGGCRCVRGAQSALRGSAGKVITEGSTPDCYEIDLASMKLLPTTSLRLAKFDASTSSR